MGNKYISGNILNSKHAHLIAPLRSIKLMIWDLDETLYYNQKTIKQVRDEYLTTYLQNTVNPFEARKKFMRLEQSGVKWFDILSGELNISQKEAIIITEAKIDKSKYVQSNPELVKYFLSSRSLHILISNSTRRSVLSILTKLGLSYPEKIFKLIRTIEDVGLLKPNMKTLSRAVRSFKIAPSQILSIGDSYKDDLLPAHQLGFVTSQINYDLAPSKADYSFSTVNEVLHMLSVNNL